MSDDVDEVMIRVHNAFFDSDLTLEELGERMGYGKSARKAAWQLLNMTFDPRLSTLRKFADAVGVDVAELFKPFPEERQ